MFRLYTTLRSANGRKPVVLCRELGLVPEVVEVDVYRGEGRSAEYRRINPWGKVPTLIDDELVLWESNAILIYLAEARGGDRLWANDPRGRAEIARWLFWEAAHWQPAVTVVAREKAAELLRVTPPGTAGEVDWERQPFSSLVERLEGRLTGFPYLAGAELTVADLSVAATAAILAATGFPFERFPALDAWYRRIEAREAWTTTAVEPWRR